ncbi:hypothetical protein FNV43_RR22854 [Rhamnella rubrinervis]|uniref:Acid phosphatase n=1 Tax=Rhamnella rubrinervis TaxID=2594499 RepID=A0A8K0GNK6_9ROSA|nr:hypothetical protein FNV43_RR22854 [Rhamnella rubrinervis]
MKIGKMKIGLMRLGLPVSSMAALVLILGLVLNVVLFCNGGKTSTYIRVGWKTDNMPLDSGVFEVPPGYNAPQQVHITQGDHVGKAVIVSWVTVDEPGSKRMFWFITPLEVGPDVPYTFGLIGDYPYDDSNRWDTWERSVAYQPWIWTVGNHEIEFDPQIVSFSYYKSHTLDG